MDMDNTNTGAETVDNPQAGGGGSQYGDANKKRLVVADLTATNQTTTDSPPNWHHFPKLGYDEARVRPTKAEVIWWVWVTVCMFIVVILMAVYTVKYRKWLDIKRFSGAVFTKGSKDHDKEGSEKADDPPEESEEKPEKLVEQPAESDQPEEYEEEEIFPVPER